MLTRKITEWLLTLILAAAIAYTIPVMFLSSCKKEEIYKTDMPKGIIKDSPKVCDTTLIAHPR